MRSKNRSPTQGERLRQHTETRFSIRHELVDYPSGHAPNLPNPASATFGGFLLFGITHGLSLPDACAGRATLNEAQLRATNRAGQQEQSGSTRYDPVTRRSESSAV